MDYFIFKRIATRISALNIQKSIEKEKKEKRDKGKDKTDETDKKEKSKEPKWSKLQNRTKTKIKPLMRELESSVSDKNKETSLYAYEKLLEELGLFAKEFGLRDLHNKLKNVEKHEFD
jgi:hypothetical protein